MLINFSFRNFASYRDQTQFSMIPGRFERFPSHVAKIADRCVLRSSFLFGANAGGKSNLAKAMAFADRIVESGMSGVSCDRKYFRLAADGKYKDEGVFQFDLFADGHFYNYGFAISYSRSCVIGEWLYCIDDPKHETCIFNREVGSDGKPVIETGMRLVRDERLRFMFCCESFEQPGMDKVLFLSDVAKRVSRRMSFADPIVAVRRWFARFYVIFPSTTFGAMSGYAKDDDARLLLGSLLKHFDTGIDNLKTTVISADKVLDEIPEKIREEIKTKLEAEASYDLRHGMTTFRDNDSSYLVAYRDGKLVFKKVMADHGNANDLFDRSDESDGTQRLFDLLPLKKMLETGCVIFIDEVDRSLHTNATYELISLFQYVSEGHLSQLIATTHDGQLMDLDKFRQDELWLVERHADHSSHLVPLSRFRIGADRDLYKGYLLGRYGALPFFAELEEGVRLSQKGQV